MVLLEEAHKQFPDPEASYCAHCEDVKDVAVKQSLKIAFTMPAAAASCCNSKSSFAHVHNNCERPEGFVTFSTRKPNCVHVWVETQKVRSLRIRRGFPPSQTRQSAAVPFAGKNVHSEHPNPTSLQSQGAPVRELTPEIHCS